MSATVPIIPALSRRTLSDTALRLFVEQGFHQVSVAQIADAAGAPLAEVYRHFGSKNDFVLGLYQRIHDTLQAQVPDLPTGSLALRFQVFMRQKLALLTTSPTATAASRRCRAASPTAATSATCATCAPTATAWPKWSGRY